MTESVNENKSVEISSTNNDQLEKFTKFLTISTEDSLSGNNKEDKVAKWIAANSQIMNPNHPNSELLQYLFLQHDVDAFGEYITNQPFYDTNELSIQNHQQLNDINTDIVNNETRGGAATTTTTTTTSSSSLIITEYELSKMTNNQLSPSAITASSSTTTTASAQQNNGVFNKLYKKITNIWSFLLNPLHSTSTSGNNNADEIYSFASFSIKGCDIKTNDSLKPFFVNRRHQQVTKNNNSIAIAGGGGGAAAGAAGLNNGRGISSYFTKNYISLLTNKNNNRNNFNNGFFQHQQQQQKHSSAIIDDKQIK